MTNKYKYIENYIFNSSVKTDRLYEKKFVDTFEYELKKFNIIPKSPLWVGLKVTSKCNMSCEHCWVDEKRKTPSLKEKKGMDRLKELEILHLTISGGEPFLRTDILDIIRYAKKKGFFVEIFTNASLLNDRIILELADILDNKRDIIQVSLDASNKNTHYKQRKNKEFNKIITNIIKIKESNLTVRVNFTATEFNQEEILSTYELCCSLNVNYFSISHVFDLNKGENLYDKVNKKIYIDEIYKTIKKSERSKTNLRIFLPIAFFQKTAQYIENKNDAVDYNYTNTLHWFIHSDGSIYPNVSLEYDEFKIGNLYDDPISYIIKNNQIVMNKLYMRDLRNTKCEHCSNYKICRGGDMGRVYKENKIIHLPDTKCMTLNRKEY